jgi:hypothetical protein
MSFLCIFWWSLGWKNTWSLFVLTTTSNPYLPKTVPRRICRQVGDAYEQGHHQPTNADSRPMRTTSFSNGSGPSRRIGVRIETQQLANWRSGLAINPNSRLGYILIVNSQPVWIEWVISRSPSGSIDRCISSSCFCSLLIVSYQLCIFDIQ